ncbi:MAG: hypothetical protein KDE51_14335, partial [Anaerolineales bacterium]|nr:hypothetical protein [Anaerolineales bacterium]
MDKQGNDGVKKAKILLIAEAVEGVLLPWYEQIKTWGGVPTIWPLAEATAAKIEATAPDVVVLDEAGLGLGRELQTAATR